MADVIATLQSLPGVGPGIAHMAVQELIDEVGYEPQSDELPGLDVKADVHVVRVFFRLGIAVDETRDAALDAARRLHPTFPGLLDWPAWDIGRRLCRPHSPACGECPLIAVCERRGLGEAHQGIRAVPDQDRRPATAPQEVPDKHGRTVNAPDLDHEFWRLLAGLLGVALQSAQSNGVAHRFASVAPHLTVDPDLAWTQCLAVTKDILAERLPTTNLSPDVDLVGEAIRVGIIKPMEAVWLRDSVDGQPPKIRLADAVTLMIQAISALG